MDENPTDSSTTLARGGHRRAVGASAAVLATVFIAGSALAQSAPPAGGAEALQGQGLEDIVVTARKRVESAQNIPVAVTAFSSEQLERKSLTNLESIAAVTPEMVIARGSTGSGAQLSLRGLGSNFTSIGIEQSVAVIVDGAYYGRGRVINEGFFDLGNVEVLKGPQALFFGKNATAGVVNINTANPTDKFEARVRTGYEFTAENVFGEAVVSGPITDKLSARFAVRGSKMFGGYFKNDSRDVAYDTFDVASGVTFPHTATAFTDKSPKEHEIIGRLTLDWRPTERFTAILKISGTDSYSNNSAGNIVAVCPGPFQQLDPTTRCEKDFRITQTNMPFDIAASGFRGARDGRPYNDYKSYAINGNLSYAFDNMTWSTVLNYQYNRNQFLIDTDYEVNALSATNTFVSDYSSWRALSAESRVLTSFDGPINVLLGAYYQHTNSYFEQNAPLFGLENSAALPSQRYIAFTKVSPTSGETVSGFGQIITKVLPRVEVTAGVRYTHETKTSSFAQVYVNPGLTGIFTPNVVLPADQTFINLSPEATVTFRPTDEITVYGAYKTGYKSGGFSNSTLFGPKTQPSDVTFGAEKAQGFEGGVKTTLLDNQLRLNLTGYSYKYSGLQIDFFNNTTIVYVTTNAGGARVRGIELSGEWAPRTIPGFRVQTAVNYNKARYTAFQGPCYAGQTIAGGCSLLSSGGALFQDLSGKPTANAPLWTAALGISYDRQITPKFMFGISADGRYSGSYLASGFGSPASKQQRYATLDASARLYTSDDRWELAVIGKNLTNQFIITGAYDITGTGSGTGTTVGVPADEAASVALPRTVLMQLTWKY